MASTLLTHFVPDQLERLGIKDPVFRDEILTQVVKTARERIGELRSACDAACFKELELAAHSLKGMALIVGAESLAEICDRLEKSSNSPSDLDYLTLCDLAIEAYTLLESEITESYPELNI